MGGSSLLFRNPASDITASAMARVKTIVIEWFAERRHLIDTLLVNLDGLDEIPRHARRQEREVKELFGPHESFSPTLRLGMDHGQQTRHGFTS